MRRTKNTEGTKLSVFFFLPQSASLLNSPTRSVSLIRTTMSFRVFFLLALLLFSSSLLQVARCDADVETVEESEEVSDLGIVGDDVQDFAGGSFSAASVVDTVCVFPKNPSKSITAGEESELLVGLKNDGDLSVDIISVQGSIHLPFDHSYLVQNLSVQGFNNASVPGYTQATFPYLFAVSKFLQAGTFDLVGTIVYEIDEQPYQSTFYNGTIEVIEPSGPISIESVFLVSLAIAIVGFIVFTVRTRIQNYSKKTKRSPKVEVGTGTTDANMDEWLEGTAYTQSNKSKKKKST